MQPQVVLMLVPGARSAESIAQRLMKVAPETIDIFSLEKYFRQLYSGEEVPVRQIAYDHSVDFIVDLWKAAVDQALEDLGESNKPIRALMLFPVWYGARRHERFCPIDVPRLSAVIESKRAIVTKVITFIDDIYDMAARYTQSGEYWDISQAATEFASSVTSAAPLYDPTSADFRDDLLGIQSVALAFWIHCLQTMLEWRRQDLLVGRNLSASLCPGGFIPFAIKQSAGVARLFLTSDAPTIYLSHPISEPRRHHAQTKAWPPMVEIINELPEQFLELGACLIMPTGIDELRLVRCDEGPVPRLSERWPKCNDLLYTDTYPSDDGEVTCDPEQVFSPTIVREMSAFAGKTIPTEYSFGYTEVRRSLASQMLSFVKAVEEQIGERDNALVLNTDAILIYRPLFSEKGRIRFSAGVWAELSFWRLLKREESRSEYKGFRKRARRCVIYHCRSDIISWLNCTIPGSTQSVRTELITHTLRAFLTAIKEDLALTDDECNSLVWEDPTVVSKVALSPARLRNCRDYCREHFRETVGLVLRAFLSGRRDIQQTISARAEADQSPQDLWVQVVNSSGELDRGQREDIVKFLDGELQNSAEPGEEEFVSELEAGARLRFVPRWRLFS